MSYLRAALKTMRRENESRLPTGLVADFKKQFSLHDVTDRALRHLISNLKEENNLKVTNSKKSRKRPLDGFSKPPQKKPASLRHHQ